MPEPLCTAISRADGEALLGTASTVRAWLLLQEQGPWGIDALTESRLDRAFSRALAERAEQARVRVILIRRPGRVSNERPRHCYLAYTGPHTRFVEGRAVTDLDELLDVDLARLRGGEPTGFGQPVSHPLYLVCTNGKHDRCCATYGRPLAQAMAATHGESVWECSHIGGDRFAANLVCLPHGLYYGAVEPAEGPPIAELYERGLLDLEHLRGRSSHAPMVQAAEHFVRQQEGLRGVDDLVVSHREVVATNEVVVHLAGPDGVRYRVRVHAEPADHPRRLTCRSVRELVPPVYRLVELRSEVAARESADGEGERQHDVDDRPGDELGGGRRAADERRQ